MDNALNKTKKHFLLWPVVVILFIVAFIAMYYLAVVYRTQQKVHSILVMNASQLKEAFASERNASLSGYDIYVLAAFAQSKNATARMLDRIARMDNPRLMDRLATFFTSLNGANKQGISVKQLVVRNPNVTPTTLAYLADSKNQALLCDIAKNEKTFILTLEKLAKSDNGVVRQCVVQNPRTPKSLLLRLRAKT